MTATETTTKCRYCGYPSSPACVVCGHKPPRSLNRRSTVQPGRGNALLDLFRGLDDVRCALFALLFERAFVGKLRGPFIANALASGLLLLPAWLWLAPAYDSWFATAHASSPYHGPHLWLIATWLAVGFPLLNLLAGFAQRPIRVATESHMLGAASPDTVPVLNRWRERLFLVLIGFAALPVAMGLVLVPWLGIPLALILGAAIAAVVALQSPLAVRHVAPRDRIALLRHNGWRALGTGLGLQLATAVPFLNVLGLAPLATVAATNAYLHFDKSATAAA